MSISPTFGFGIDIDAWIRKNSKTLEQAKRYEKRGLIFVLYHVSYQFTLEVSGIFTFLLCEHILCVQTGRK